MSETLDLLRAVLGPDVTSPARALQVLETALEAEVDVLLYCATSLGLGATLVMRRAADWAGLAYFDRVPGNAHKTLRPPYLETLATVRLVRVQMLDRELAFAAPDFEGVLRLRRQLAVVPGLRQQLCLVPEPALRDYLATVAAPDLVDVARQNLVRYWPLSTAQLELTKWARWSFVGLLAAILVTLLLAPFFMQAALLPLMLALLVAPAALRWGAVFNPLRVVSADRRPPDAELPVYSVLVPLHDEAEMVPQLFASLGALDYPPERLDIKFVVEARSKATLDAVRQRLGDPRFSLIAVPDAQPRTKPKAINFALPLCRGDYVVVYDAEDIVEPSQLWKAAARFRDDPGLACLQACLVIGNGRRSWLAAVFAGEYAGLFTVFLPALARWRLPMPLGGTSNHFPIAVLKDLGGWDAFNVTEDADLGVRIARRRLRVDVLQSTTRETAPTRLRPWLGQRSRWMKGWMQTFVVHNRRPRQLLRDMGWPAFLGFEVLVLGMILTPMLHVGFTLLLGWRWLSGDGGMDGAFWTALYLAVLLFGYGSSLAMTLLGLRRLRRHQKLYWYQFLLPFYWALVGIATLRAARELVFKPFYWFKSPHEPEVSDMTVIAPVKARSWVGRLLGIRT